MKRLGLAAVGMALFSAPPAMAQYLSYDGVWGARYWECIERAGKRTMRGPLSVEQAVDAAFATCRKERPRAMTQLARIIPSSSLSPENLDGAMQASEASIRRSMIMHFTEMRKIPGFKRTHAQD